MTPDWRLLGDGPLALAVSGGADSFALLHAVHARGLPLVALTVDHGLREGAAADARAVADWCAERGVPHETLRWEGPKPTTGVQAAARTARYRLLCEACERLGLDRLATGHTLDDQAETVFMRLRRGAGRGLAGMPTQRKIASGPGEPVTLLRPMLGVRREETQGYAAAHALPVRADPSNDDEDFERVRVRAVLAALEEQRLLGAAALVGSAQGVASLVRDVGPAHYWDQTDYEYAFEDDGSVHAWDGDWIDGYGGEHAHAFRRHAAEFLRQVIRAIGGTELSRTEDVPVLVPDGQVAVAGVMLSLSGGTLSAYREPAALLGRADGTPGLAPVPAPPGSRHLYDRRFVVTVPEGADPATELRPLGQVLPRAIATSTPARSRAATLPVLSVGERVTHLPEPAARAVRDALSSWKGAEALLPPETATFPARSLLAERFANEVIRY